MLDGFSLFKGEKELPCVPYKVGGSCCDVDPVDTGDAVPATRLIEAQPDRGSPLTGESCLRRAAMPLLKGTISCCRRTTWLIWAPASPQW